MFNSDNNSTSTPTPLDDLFKDDKAFAVAFEMSLTYDLSDWRDFFEKANSFLSLKL